MGDWEDVQVALGLKDGPRNRLSHPATELQGCDLCVSRLSLVTSVQTLKLFASCVAFSSCIRSSL